LEVVRSVLQPVQCFLQSALHPKGQAAQYHFEGDYGVTVLFVAGYDASRDCTGQAPMAHAARFWIAGNTHPRSLDLQQQIRTKLVALTNGTPVEALPLMSKGA